MFRQGIDEIRTVLVVDENREQSVPDKVHFPGELKPAVGQFSGRAGVVLAEVIGSGLFHPAFCDRVTVCAPGRDGRAPEQGIEGSTPNGAPVRHGLVGIPFCPHHRLSAGVCHDLFLNAAACSFDTRPPFQTRTQSKS